MLKVAPNPIPRSVINEVNRVWQISVATLLALTVAGVKLRFLQGNAPSPLLFGGPTLGNDFCLDCRVLLGPNLYG